MGAARLGWISVLSIGVAVLSSLAARVLVMMISFITNLAFFGRISGDMAAPSDHRLGMFVVLVPVVGGLLVGLMARYGSKAIRGHGIPEAMDQVLTNQSRIPARFALLKPVSAAIAIGTGGPFGAEGPIMATGGALGSLVSQLVSTTSIEGKTLLAAGAAAGMAATFGSPLASVLLALELLLFEFRPRSLIPVTLASVTAAGLRRYWLGGAPIFSMPWLDPPTGGALLFYAFLGLVIGLVAIVVTRAVYWVEDAFEKLPVHWMWWPAFGGLVVGGIGVIEPRTMGVGYDNIDSILAGSLSVNVLLALFSLKFLSWVVALGSGTSGGTLAPLFTVGGGIGACLGALGRFWVPWADIDPRVAALVGMAAMFAGASRALLASVVFAFEVTLQPYSVLPLLGGCVVAYWVSGSLMRNTIMTEKIVRRGIRVPHEYHANVLEQIRVRDLPQRPPVCWAATDTLENVRAWLDSGAPGTDQESFAVVADNGSLVGLVMRQEVLAWHRPPSTPIHQLLTQPPVVIPESDSLSDVVELMAQQGLERVPVVSESDWTRMIGILSMAEVLAAGRRRLHDEGRIRPRLKIREQFARKVSKP